MHLVEFIEDCQSSQLHLQVLNILNKEAANTKSNPAKYIRFINNRLNLEEAEIRAACVGTLGKFALNFPELKNDIIEILKQ